MAYYSSIYGLGIRINEKIPGIVAASSTTNPVDVEIFLGFMPTWVPGQPKESWYISPDHEQDSVPLLTVWKLRNGDYYQLRYADDTEFLVDRLGRYVWATWPSETLTLEDTATYFLGPVMGFVLLLRGHISLHASAIVIDGKAVAFVGPAGSGKSTTAAAFAELGYSVLAEDVLRLDEQGNSFLVHPAYPCIRLWPSGVKALFGTRVELPRLTPTWDKRYLDLDKDQYDFQDHPLPLAAIYMLDERSNDCSSPVVKKISSADALIALIANTYVYYLMDREMLARKFELFNRVLAHVPIRRITPHKDPIYISKLCTTILEHFKDEQESALHV